MVEVAQDEHYSTDFTATSAVLGSQVTLHESSVRPATTLPDDMADSTKDPFAKVES